MKFQIKQESKRFLLIDLDTLGLILDEAEKIEDCGVTIVQSNANPHTRQAVILLRKTEFADIQTLQDVLESL